MFFKYAFLKRSPPVLTTQTHQNGYPKCPVKNVNMAIPLLVRVLIACEGLFACTDKNNSPKSGNHLLCSNVQQVV